MLLFAMVLSAAKPSAPAPLKAVVETLQTIGFSVSKTELDKKSHWVNQTKVPVPTRIDSFVLRRPGAGELTAEQWGYPSADAAKSAKKVLDRDVTNASWPEGQALIVVTASKPELNEHLSALIAHHKDCTLAPPWTTLLDKVQDYKVKDRTLVSLTESGVLPTGERVQITRSQCASVSVSYRFFVEVKVSDAMTKVQEMLAKLAPLTRKPADVDGLAKALRSAWLNADVKIGPFSSVRATYDDRGAEPTLSVEYVDAP